MIVAELLRRLPDSGDIEVLARILAPDPYGPAVIEADPSVIPLVEEILSIGAPGPRDHIYYLEDGEAFVRLLPSAFRGERLWAELVE
jgi:hypothetical protein